MPRIMSRLHASLDGALAPFGIYVGPSNTTGRRLDAWRTDTAYFLVLGRWELVVDRHHSRT